MIYYPLMGDSSDNIPGIAGIGPKTALKLISEYGSLDNIIDNKDNITNKKLSEKVKNGLNDLELSKTLVQLKYDVECDWEYILSPKEQDINNLKKII